MNCPWLKPQVKDTRSILQKIKDGVINLKTLSSAGIATSSLISICKTLANTGSLTGTAMFSVLIFFNSISTMCNSFKFAYNKKQRSI